MSHPPTNSTESQAPVGHRGHAAGRDAAPLVEIFASLQGEGAFAGELQLFVRFAGCPLRCNYCDSEHTWFAGPGWDLHLPDGTCRNFTNPATLAQIVDAVALLDGTGPARTVSITGGEPLVHAEFLQKLLPALRARGHRVHLETAGVHARELQQIIALVDHVSADYKLKSTMETGDFEGAHGRFLAICHDAGVDTAVKCIITDEVTDLEFDRAVGVVADLNADWLFVVQPATPMRHVANAPAPARVERLTRRAMGRLRRVRVLPQIHRLMGLR